MKKTIFAAMFAMFAMFAGTASANAGAMPYAGIGLGGFNIKLGNSVNKTALGGYIRYGADFNEWFGAEIRAGMTGNVKGNTTKARASWFASYLLKPQYTFSDTARMYLLFGGTTAKIKTSTNAVGNKFTKTGLSYGVGGEFVVADNVSAGVEWVQYWHKVSIDAAKYGSGKGKIWSAAATLSYLF